MVSVLVSKREGGREDSIKPLPGFSEEAALCTPGRPLECLTKYFVGRRYNIISISGLLRDRRNFGSFIHLFFLLGKKGGGEGSRGSFLQCVPICL